MYTLKPTEPDFTVVDGPARNKAYRRGETYAEIPEEYRDRFAEIVTPREQATPAPPAEPEPQEKHRGGKADKTEGGN